MLVNIDALETKDPRNHFGILIEMGEAFGHKIMV